jgi:tRNA pseudouridine55 synthase
LASAATQRDIPPDRVCARGETPGPLDAGVAFLVDKPSGPTSFDVVETVREATGISKVGHAGTLDPMATGLLIVLVARPATRLQEAFMHLPKTYEGTMRLGERTPSHDAETEVTDRTDVSDLTAADLRAVREDFTGPLEQIPPMYSAVKVDGERLYKKARRGETVDRPPRQVTVDTFEYLDWSPPDLTFRVVCSKGFYVRSLARDVGEALGVGAHLTALRRTDVGPYSVSEAWSVPALETTLSQTQTNE